MAGMEKDSRASSSLSAPREHAFHRVARCLSNIGRHKRYCLAERSRSNALCAAISKWSRSSLVSG
jgi:hypothetical protein